MTQREDRRVRSSERPISAAAAAKFATAADPLASVQNSECDERGLPDITADQFGCIARVVLKANPEAASQLGALRSRLADLLLNGGIVNDGTGYGDELYKLARREKDHSEKARRFRKVASSGKPLEPTLYIDTMMAELYLTLRQPPKRADPILVPFVRGRMAASLAQRSVPEIQAAARHLATYHQAQVRRGRPQRYDLDATLEELGDIYASITGYKKHRHCLSISERSLFGQFCRAVLEPHCKASERSFSALSGRWERIKEHASRPADCVKRAPKRVLRPRKKQEPIGT